MALKVEPIFGETDASARRAKGQPRPVRWRRRTFWAKLGVTETVAKTLLRHVPPRVTASVYDQHSYISETLEALALWDTHHQKDYVALDV